MTISDQTSAELRAQGLAAFRAKLGIADDTVCLALRRDLAKILGAYLTETPFSNLVAMEGRTCTIGFTHQALNKNEPSNTTLCAYACPSHCIDSANDDDGPCVPIRSLADFGEFVVNYDTPEADEWLKDQ